MAEPRGGDGAYDEKTFLQQLSAYNDQELRMVWDYYRDDLTYILDNVNQENLLRELTCQNVLNTKKNSSVDKDSGSSLFSTLLLQDLSDSGREAVFGFLACLCRLQNDHSLPNILVILSEICQTGKHLVEQILLDEQGHLLPSQLKDIQEQHRQYLLEKTQTLLEHRPPGSSLKEQSFLINDRYVNLTVVSTDQFRQRHHNEIINTGIKHEECLKEAQTGLEHISLNKLFRWCHQLQRVPCTVMVSGVPGIGKSTLMQKVVYDWVNRKSYQRFAFVFLFRFRELNKLVELTLEDLLIHQYPYLEPQLGNILQYPERLLFVFDGLDESIHQMDFSSSKLLTNPKQKEKFGIVLVSLVKQSLLKGCSVLTTSRPTKLASIDTGDFHRLTEIMGFLHGDRRIYFDQFFENSILSEKAFLHVQQNDLLYTFCYIPAYCWILCRVLSMCFSTQGTNSDPEMSTLPKTMTQLFVAFVSNILTNHCQNTDDTQTVQELLTYVGRMAEHGVMNHIIVFDQGSLESFRVTPNKHPLSCFMIESGHPPDVDYTFLHLTLQEFFAALLHFVDYDPDKLQKSLEKAESHKDGRAEIFLRFLCGLSDKSTRSMLKAYMGGSSSRTTKDVISWLQQSIAKERRPDKHTRELLNLCYCLSESRNKALVSQCFRSNKNFDFSGLPLTPVDCCVLSFILESCKDTELLKLERCKIQNDGLQKLTPVLHTIKSLSLLNNNLTSSSCTHLASMVKHNEALKILRLTHNNLEGPYFSDLMEAVATSRIEALDLGGNKLTDISCKQLASGIKNNKTLKKLSLSGNNLEGPHFSDLMEALAESRVEELHLENNGLTDESCTHLASGIRNNQTLKRLGLSANNLEGPHFREMMEALTTGRIEELYLYDNDLTDSSCTHLATGIRNNKTLRRLKLSFNILEGPLFKDLMDAVPTSRIEELDLGGNMLKSSSVTFLASGIRHNETLKRLDLTGNYLEGPHFSEIMEALPTSRIEELQLTDNKLTDSCCAHLITGIRNNQTLRTLGLCYNNLEGPHFTDLMAALSHPTCKIEFLQISRSSLSREARRQLKTLGSRRPGLWITG
ncbi:NACHT, LRR and PYD domains-containing protein 3-like isoform X2 [Hyperolius riggenbachi]|uniref:NACHT, LRR and PYD domains-containing protein 3-like isoform X2 n=1 Tax=Hyperolius riggenbachi TaxID=752182 RepID=UPI0035A381FA